MFFDIGPFRLDSQARVLTRSGAPEPLGSRAVAVLAALVEHAGEPVLKSALMEIGWPGVVVEESNLSVQVSAIRRVLAKAPGGDRWIETLARRGYRYVGPVTAISSASNQDTGDAAARSNLPVQVTSFIGRDRESRELAGLLPLHRLITLVGTGGIGKTRLALAVASRMVDDYCDGVWFVDAGPIADPNLLTHAVANAMHLRDVAGKPLLETLCDRARNRSFLLLLDNCEHLMAAAAVLADGLLKRAAGVTILATSREPMHLAGEQVYPLQPLSLPERGADDRVIEQCDAVRLFVERARQQLPTFELTPRNGAAIAELCIQLDGIPLALELAAARLPALSIEEINTRLGDRFRLLTGRANAVLPRQQTLRATLDWSFELLSEEERIVLRRLARFSGGFTLDAASFVCGDETIASNSVIDLLAQLVDRSLVAADTGRPDTRYRMLETTRAYADEKLAAAGETAAIERRRAQHFRDRFDGALRDSMRLPEGRWREIYLPERDNVRAALDWAFGDTGDRQLGVALAGGSAFLWTELSLQSEGRERLEAAVAAMDGDTPDVERARIWLALATLWGTAAPARAVESAESAIALHRQLADPLLLGKSLAWLGRMLVFMGQFERAAPVFAEARTLLEEVGLEKPLGSCLEGLAFLEMLTGELTAASHDFERALSLFRAAGADSSVFGVLVNLADLTWALGDLDAALLQCREGVRLIRSAPIFAKEMLGTCLTNLAGVLIERGELAEALVVAREGLPLRNQSGHAWVAMDHFALRAALVGHLEHAARIAGFADATHAAKQSLRQPNEARAHANLMALLRERLPGQDLARLLAAGAVLSDDEACRLALEH